MHSTMLPHAAAQRRAAAHRTRSFYLLRVVRYSLRSQASLLDRLEKSASMASKTTASSL